MKKKRGLCMADGGLIEDKEAAWARRKAEIYASTGLSSKRREPEPEVAPAPPPAPTPAPRRRGGLMGAFDALTNRKRQIEEAAGYAQGGIVRGPGGPEDDEVPMQIAGKDVRLSNTEAVLPARTVQALGGPKAVERLIEVTNGKPPVKGGLREGGKYYGGLVDDFGYRVKARGQMPPVTVNDSVTGEVAKPNVRPTIAGQQDFRANAPQPTPQPSSAAPQAPAAPQPGAATGQTAKAATPAASRLAQVSENFGRTLGKAYGSAPKPGMGNAIGPIVAGGLELVDKDQSRLFNDPEAAVGDKARAFGRATTRLAGATIGGALGMGLGSGGGPAGTVTGGALLGTGGAILGDKLGEAIFGDPVGDHKKRVAAASNEAAQQDGLKFLTQEQIAAAKAAHENVMAGGNGNGAVAPIGIDRKMLANPPVVGGKLDEAVKTAEKRQTAAEAIDPVTKLPVGLAAAAKANDGRANFIASMDATKYNPAEGTGVITRAPGKDGLRSATFIGGPSAADAARDAKFEAAGYSKDMYGNWMTPQRQALQQANKEWEERNYKKSPMIDPMSSQIEEMRKQREALDSEMDDASKVKGKWKRMAAMQAVSEKQRALMAEMGMVQSAQQHAADLGLRRQQMEQSAQLAREKAAAEGRPSFRDQLELAKFQFEKQNDAEKRRNLQGNNERDYRNTVIKQNNERIEKWLDTMAPTQGLKGDDLRAAQQRRAFLQEAVRSGWGGNVAIDPAAFESEMPEHSRQARATMALYDALSKDSGVGAFFRNGFRDAALSQQAIVPKSYDEKRDILVMPDGYEIPGKSVWGADADIRAAILARMKQAAEEGKK